MLFKILSTYCVVEMKKDRLKGLFRTEVYLGFFLIQILQEYYYKKNKCNFYLLQRYKCLSLWKNWGVLDKGRNIR